MRQNLKIIFITLDQTLVGGVERVISNQASFFERMGFDVEVISLIKSNESENYKLPKNVVVTYIFQGKKFMKIYKLLALIYVLIILKPIKERHIFISTMPLFSILIGFLRPSIRIRLIAAEHSPYDAHKGIISYLRLRSYRKIKNVVTLTQSDSNKFNDNSIEAIVIPNAITNFESPFQFKEKKKEDILQPFTCIAVGRLNQVKGYERLLKLAKHVVEMDCNIRFQIVGSGSEKLKLNNLKDKMGLSKNLEIIDATPNIADYYKKASMLIMTSWFEAFPMVLIEAHSFALPTLAYNCPVGPSEIIVNGKNGYLFNDNEMEIFATKIVELKNNYNEWKILSKGALESAKKFNELIIGNKWSELVHDSK